MVERRFTERRKGFEMKPDMTMRELPNRRVGGFAAGIPESLIDRLMIRATIRRNATTRKSVTEGKPDRIADLLEEAAIALQRLS